MIIGSFPIGKFTDPDRRDEIKAHEYNFFFGGERNLLWKLIAHAQGLTLNSKEDVITMLEKMNLAVGDVILSCRRKKGGASDSDLYDIEFNLELLSVIRLQRIHKVYFTSRKVESWFNRLFPDSHDLEKVNLISPSAQTLRSLGKNPEYALWKLRNKNKASLNFLYESYAHVFGSMKF